MVLNSQQLKGKTYLQKWVQQTVQHGLALSDLGDWLYQARVELSESHKLRKEIPLLKPPTNKYTSSSTSRSNKREHASKTRPSTPQRKEFAAQRANSGSPSPQYRWAYPCFEGDSGHAAATQHSNTNTIMTKPQLNQSRGSEEPPLDGDEHYMSNELFSATLEKIQENLHQNLVHASRQLQALQSLHEGQDSRQHCEDLQPHTHRPQTPRRSCTPSEPTHPQHSVQVQCDTTHCLDGNGACVDYLAVPRCDANCSCRCFSDLDEKPQRESQVDWSPEHVMINHSKMISVATPRNQWLQESCSMMMPSARERQQ